ncbi:MAG: TolC family protein [Myxococcota bacterium]|nr:TolC family protein [Myxococcota bacterium]
MRIAAGGVGLLLTTSLSLTAATAGAQEATPSSPPVPQGPVAPMVERAAPVAVPTDLVRAQPGGLTSEQAGMRAGATSWSAKASMEAVRGAAARVDEAWASFLPRLSGLGRYTRLSPLTPPSLGTLVGSTQNLAPGDRPSVDSLIAIPLTFPVVLDNWLFQATLTVPVSDYFFRIDQTYTAATRSEDAARWDVVAARASSSANGQIAYYTWLRARGGVIVAVQALNDQKTHLRDSRNQFTVGNASKADVMRAETAVASAELALERAKNLADLSEKQVRVAIHARDEEVIAPGEDLEAPPIPVQGSVKQMTAEALTARPEVKSADANAASAREQTAAGRAGRYPSLSAFADGIVANPNSRIFPQTAKWFPTWDVGAQVTWSPNDVLVANGSVADLESRAAAIEANRNNVRDGIEVEVTQYWQAVREADFAIESSTRELASAEEAYRVAGELFNNGRGTSTTLTDAETDLTRARLDLLNAKSDARIARIRLQHALGRDARSP